jgi:hypothetical protein
MGHAGVQINPNAVLEHGIDSDAIAQIHHRMIADSRDNDTHIDSYERRLLVSVLST